MKINCRKVSRVLLMGLLALILLVQAAAADTQISLVFNGQEYRADVYVEKGISYVSVASLEKIPSIEVVQEGYVPLRQFFESRDGDVKWDHTRKQINVSWQEKRGEWSADELVVESSKILQDLNTYRMKGTAGIQVDISGADADVPEMPEMSTSMDGVFQQKPLAMYIKQTVGLPIENLELTEEEAALLQQGEMVTEMVWTDNAIYQKMPLMDQWIVQDLSGTDMMGQLTNMLQTTPQQSLDMMRDFGIIYVFGEDVVIDGQEYYTVKNYVDSTTFKKVIEEYMNDLNMAELIMDNQVLPEQGQDGEGMTPSMNEIQQVFEKLLATMEMNYYIDSFINKETLLTESMKYDMDMKYSLDETISPQGPVTIQMKMVGEYDLYDFGTKIQLPDVSNSITQEEYMEQMLNEVETPQD